MRASLLLILILLPTFGIVKPAGAVTIRYALIVGNNVGVDEDKKEPFSPLNHAEKDAIELRNYLVGLSNFDSSSARTRLMTGATVEEIKEAVSFIVRQKKKDESLLGKTDSLFLFYFAGHGLLGSLLLEDGPLTASDLGDLFKSVNADYAIGVFDARYSGSLDDSKPAENGIDPTPGLNLLEELPEEVLTAEGSIWYVSSGSGQSSCEDDSLGGVFTHFFIEALEEAQKDGPGITLDQIWNYTRQHTVDYTAARNRKQLPEQYIARLKSSASIYFSFPHKPKATLALSESLDGQFVLAYGDGHLTKIIDKTAGEKLELAIYPGRARLMLPGEGDGLSQKEFTLKSGEELVLRQLSEEGPPLPLGRQAYGLWPEGIGLDKKVTATKFGLGISLLGGVAYEFALATGEALLPRHTFALALRFDRGGFLGAIRVGYGHDRREFSAWSYKAHAVTGEFHSGHSWDLGPTRLNFGGAFAAAYIQQIYDNDEQRNDWNIRPAANLVLLYPRTGKFVAEVFISAGPTYSPGIGADSKNMWHFSGVTGLVFYYRLK